MLYLKRYRLYVSVLVESWKSVLHLMATVGIIPHSMAVWACHTIHVCAGTAFGSIIRGCTGLSTIHYAAAATVFGIGI